jgi:hypothetical protein
MKPRLVLLGVRAGVLALGLVVASEAALPAAQYETPSSVSASQVVPPKLLRRPNYRIGDRVGLENFQYAFKVHTKYGTFVIKGTDLLRVRARARAPSIERGFFYRRQAALIAAYNKRVAPIRQFVRFGSAPMLETGKGIVSFLPVDYLIWTPPLEQLAASAGGHGGGAPSEIWITGQASEMATTKLAELGWKVVPNAATQLGQ